jgi:amidase
MAAHRYEPTRYHATLGSHEPVLSIADGDTVDTSTLDASGCDAAGIERAAGLNPQTGPFLVKGAEPGDVLAVRFNRLRPNRDRGYSWTRLAPHLVEADAVFELPAFGRAEWHVDCEMGTATLLSPQTTVGALVLPIRPMLGCFGVAPADGQSISARTSGTHGGNMDYRGFVEGVTVFLPVFVPGALFSLGDGHAAQGDGEILGTGIEISFDVRFTISIIRQKSIGWPRAEDGDAIMAIGNGRPLDQAMQFATTEMLRWLQTDYRLDPTGANLLLGSCVKYDIGNVCDPEYTVVCRLAKKWLITSQRGSRV